MSVPNTELPFQQAQPTRGHEASYEGSPFQSSGLGLVEAQGNTGEELEEGLSHLVSQQNIRR